MSYVLTVIAGIHIPSLVGGILIGIPIGIGAVVAVRACLAASLREMCDGPITSGADPVPVPARSERDAAPAGAGAVVDALPRLRAGERGDHGGRALVSRINGRSRDRGLRSEFGERRSVTHRPFWE